MYVERHMILPAKKVLIELGFNESTQMIVEMHMVRFLVVAFCINAEGLT